MTTKADISEWFDRGKREGAAFMLVVCDTFDYSDYAVYANDGEDAWRKHDAHAEVDMQRVMEVYDLRQPKEPQLREHRAYNLPPRWKT